MATPTLQKFRLPGTQGDLLVDVRTGGGSAARPAVVILHGFKGFKDWGMFPLLADRLARAGFAAISYNASGSGVDDTGEFSFPERFGHATFSADLSDLDTVASALVDGRFGAPPSSVGLVGHSRGGGTAVLGAAELAAVGALVTWAAIGTVHRWPENTRRIWRERGRLDVTNQRTGQVLPLYPDVLDDIDRNADRLDIEAAAARLAIPWLLVHGTEDETVHVAEGRMLAAANPAATPLWIEGAGHTFGAAHPLERRPPSLEQVLDATVAFLSRTLS